MDDLDRVRIAGRVRDQLKRKPFGVDRVEVVTYRDDFKNIFPELTISDAERELLKDAPEYLKRYTRGISLELSNSSKSVRRGIGLVPVSEYVIVVLKVENIAAEEKLLGYSVDMNFLHMMRLTILDIMGKFLPGSTIDYRRFWTDEEVDASVIIAVRPYKHFIKTMKIVFGILLAELVLVFLLFLLGYII